MELRHLRYFIAVAEELHFARAAERLHMEQSPLSRAIKDLECDLGARLFDRTTRSTRITWAGQVFLDEARRVIAALDQAKASVRAAANGYHGHLRIGLSKGLAQPRLAALLAHCRDEEPDMEIRLFEMPFVQQLKGLRGDLLDVGFALAYSVQPISMPSARYPRIRIDLSSRFEAAPIRHRVKHHKFGVAASMRKPAPAKVG